LSGEKSGPVFQDSLGEDLPWLDVPAGTIQTFQELPCRRKTGGGQKGRTSKEKLMRNYVLAAIAAACFVLPTTAFSQVEVGPGGVRVGPGYHRYYNRDEGRCHELRQACLHKNELGEQGMGNCQRYRTVCR
jgi:hypothetical protein